MKNSFNTLALPATFEDLLFLNKNKEYGAYILRKLYKRHMIIACFISITVFTLSVSSPLFFNKDGDNIITKPKYRIREINLPPPPPIEGQDKKPVEDIKIAIKTVAFTVPVVRPDELVTVESMPTIDSLIDAVPWTSTNAGVTGGVDVTLLDPVDVPQNNITKHDETQPAFTWAEVMPSYPGGDNELYSFFSREIQYPEIARKAGIEGKVFLTIVVEKDGSVSNARIARGIGGGCEEEALRVLLLTGKWRPGRQNGAPVRVSMTVPVVFVLR